MCITPVAGKSKDPD